MSEAAQIPVRCELSIVSAPPVLPIDLNTGAPVKFWRAQDVAFQIGTFDAIGVCVDFSNLVSLQLIVQKTPTSVFRLIDKQLGVDDIVPVISRGEWVNGTAQQATFDLLASETDVGLDGQDSAQFWLIIRGVTDSGQTLNYGGGYIRIYNPGNQTPPTVAGIVSLHQTTNSTGNAVVTPTALIHTEEIIITGIASTRAFLVDPLSLPAGAQVWLKFIFESPPVPSIVIQVWSGSLAGAKLIEYSTDAFQPNALVMLNASGLGGFSNAVLVSPAYPET